LIKLSKEERRAALVAAKSMGLSIAGVDLLQSDRGALVLEVNSSPGLQGIEKATQKDIAGIIVEFITKKVKERRSKKSTRTKIKSNA
jgi:ribosomal protein S6--L-glutamate ligase